MKKALSLILAAIILFTALPLTASAETAAITMTPDITDAVFEYLDEIYIKKYPELGLEFSFGSEADKKVLQILAEMLTKNCKSDEEKAAAVAGWADRNINYRSYTAENGTYYYPVDVFYHRTGNCLGLGLFISQVLRLAGVPAVFCAGTRGDMKDYIKLEKRDIDHGWVMVYYNNTWNLYDPLFEVFGTNDREFISRWYFTDFMEGVSPYYKGMNCSYVYYGDSIFYIDGRFVHYKEGVPASEYYQMAAEGGSSLNGCVPYFTKNRYFTENGGTDGFQYLTNPERKDKMINDECYSGGWIGYGVPWSYTYENGIMAGCTVKEYNGEKLYLPFNSSPLRVQGDVSDYTFTFGMPTFILGNEISLPEPLWLEQEKADGRVITYESLTPEIATVDKDGKLTALKEGGVIILIASRESYDDPGCSYSGFIEIYVAEKERVYDYSDYVFNGENAQNTDIKLSGNDGIVAKSELSVSKLLADVSGAVVKDVNGKEIAATEDVKLGSGMTVALPDGTEYTVVVMGDLDSDGVISASDARLTLRASVGLEGEPADWFNEAGNVQEDGEAPLSAADARIILRGSVGLESQDDWFKSA